MQIMLNGDPHQADEGTTVADLVAGLNLGGQRYAVEVNEVLVPRSTHGEHVLRPGDRVEVVRAIGGG